MLYLNALENQTIPDTETLSLDYLPNQSPIEAQHLYIDYLSPNVNETDFTTSRALFSVTPKFNSMHL